MPVQPPAGRPSPTWRDVEPALPPRSVLQAHGARVLDPQSAMRLPGEPAPRPTVYVGDSLIVPTHVRFDIALTDLITDVAGRLGIGIPALRAQEKERALAASARAHRRAGGRAGSTSSCSDAGTDPCRRAPRTPGGCSSRSAPRRRTTRRGPLWPVSAWITCCSAARTSRGIPSAGWRTSTACPFGIDEYAYAGSGGRAPVTWVGADPAYQPEFTGRRPVVAVLDTGCGDHAWLRQGVQIGLEYNGIQAGLTDPATDPELYGDIAGPMDGSLDSHSGHGTFIAGLIRQICPMADIIAVRIMGSDGVVHERDLLRAMNVVGAYVEANADADGRPPIDVVSLSLGYYDERHGRPPVWTACCWPRPAPWAGSAWPWSPARATTPRLGRCIPAAFAPHRGGLVTDFSRDCVPVLSVGALNPDGTIALFSNGGDWVLTWEEGAALVSTFPQTFNGGAQPSVEVPTPIGLPRATIDEDSFVGGFGTWSGTSFATPILAAKLAAGLLTQDTEAVTEAAGDPVGRMWDAIHGTLGWERPTS